MLRLHRQFTGRHPLQTAVLSSGLSRRMPEPPKPPQSFRGSIEVRTMDPGSVTFSTNSRNRPLSRPSDGRSSRFPPPPPPPPSPWQQRTNFPGQQRQNVRRRPVFRVENAYPSPHSRTAAFRPPPLGPQPRTTLLGRIEAFNDWFGKFFGFSSDDGMHAKDRVGQATVTVALLGNLFVAIIKAGAAWVTSSGVMFAEALHSFADVANQSLLLVRNE